MATRERAVDRGDRVARRALRQLGEDLLGARRSAGLSQAAVGHASGVSHTTVSRLERALEPDVPLRVLARVLSTVGLDLTARAYPGPDTIRDAAQVALLEQLHQVLGPALQWRTEVPLPGSGDLRAWDACISSERKRVGVEAETRLDDVQALTRRIAMKRRDAHVDVVILLAADTVRNRAAIAAAAGSLRDYPVDTRSVLRELRAGRLPSASALVVLRVSKRADGPRPHPTIAS